LKFGSLFTGIGGIDLGFERAGMDCAWQVEIDDYCNKVLEKHWPNVERFKDVRAVGKHNLTPVDLIAGGFPCQPHSVAGKRRGKDDDRNLWPHYLRIIRELKPRWVVGENVPGIITTMLDDVLADLEGAGYTAVPFNIPAAAFGANHRRYRIFIVAHAEKQHGAINGQKTSESGRRSKDVADAKSERRGETRKDSQRQAERAAVGSYLSNPNAIRCDLRKIEGQGIQRRDQTRDEVNTGGENVSNTQIAGLERSDTEGAARPGRWTMQQTGCNWWSVEPDVGRVADGVPNRVDRLKSLGNAVVPQVAEYIGRCIMEADSLDNSGA
jgi:DNA (cytosine-5)-methyltransferase 1